MAASARFDRTKYAHANMHGRDSEQDDDPTLQNTATRTGVRVNAHIEDRQGKVARMGGLYQPTSFDRDRQRARYEGTSPGFRQGAQEGQFEQDRIAGMNSVLPPRPKKDSALAGVSTAPVMRKPERPANAGGDVYDVGFKTKALASQHGTGKSVSKAPTPLADKLISNVSNSVKSVKIPGLAPLSMSGESAPKKNNASGDELRQMIAEGRANADNIPASKRWASAEPAKQSPLGKIASAPPQQSPERKELDRLIQRKTVTPDQVKKLADSVRSKQFGPPAPDQKAAPKKASKAAPSLVDMRRRDDANIAKTTLEKEIEESSKTPAGNVARGIGKGYSNAWQGYKTFVKNTPIVKGANWAFSPVDPEKKKKAEERLKKLTAR